MISHPHLPDVLVEISLTFLLPKQKEEHEQQHEKDEKKKVIGNIGWMNEALEKISERFFSVVLKRPVVICTIFEDSSISFAKTSPLLFISESSMQDLNGRLVEPASIIQFRPNIILSNVSKPYEEDEWVGFKLCIGNIMSSVLECCSRCRMVCVHPSTGEPQLEPLATLYSYRRILDEQSGTYRVHFGILASADGYDDNISIGEEIFLFQS